MTKIQEITLLIEQYKEISSRQEFNIPTLVINKDKNHIEFTNFKAGSLGRSFFEWKFPSNAIEISKQLRIKISEISQESLKEAQEEKALFRLIDIINSLLLKKISKNPTSSQKTSEELKEMRDLYTTVAENIASKTNRQFLAVITQNRLITLACQKDLKLIVYQLLNDAPIQREEIEVVEEYLQKPLVQFLLDQDLLERAYEAIKAGANHSKVDLISLEKLCMNEKAAKDISLRLQLQKLGIPLSKEIAEDKYVQALIALRDKDDAAFEKLIDDDFLKEFEKRWNLNDCPEIGNTMLDFFFKNKEQFIQEMVKMSNIEDEAARKYVNEEFLKEILTPKNLQNAPEVPHFVMNSLFKICPPLDACLSLFQACTMPLSAKKMLLKTAWTFSSTAVMNTERFDAFLGTPLVNFFLENDQCEKAYQAIEDGAKFKNLTDVELKKLLSYSSENEETKKETEIVMENALRLADAILDTTEGNKKSIEYIDRLNTLLFGELTSQKALDISMNKRREIIKREEELILLVIKGYLDINAPISCQDIRFTQKYFLNLPPTIISLLSPPYNSSIFTVNTLVVTAFIKGYEKLVQELLLKGCTVPDTAPKRLHDLQKEIKK